MSKKIKKVLCIIMIAISMMAMVGCDSSSGVSDDEVEKMRDELYYEGPDGKWYLK